MAEFETQECYDLRLLVLLEHLPQVLIPSTGQTNLLYTI